MKKYRSIPYYMVIICFMLSGYFLFLYFDNPIKKSNLSISLIPLVLLSIKMALRHNNFNVQADKFIVFNYFRPWQLKRTYLKDDIKEIELINTLKYRGGDWTVVVNLKNNKSNKYWCQDIGTDKMKEMYSFLKQQGYLVTIQFPKTHNLMY